MSVKIEITIEPDGNQWRYEVTNWAQGWAPTVWEAIDYAYVTARHEALRQLRDS